MGPHVGNAQIQAMTDRVERIKSTLEKRLREQKELFFTVFQRFSMAYAECAETVAERKRLQSAEPVDADAIDPDGRDAAWRVAAVLGEFNGRVCK